MKFNVVKRNPSRCFGRFSLSIWDVEHKTLAVKRIMSQCVIVRAEMVYIAGRIEYEALSWRFREVPEGEVMPTYAWTWDDATADLSVEEVKP